MSSHRSIKRIVAVVYKAGLYGLPVAFAMALIHGAPADALTNQPISPIASDMINQQNGPGETRIKHVLKHETSSTIDRLDLVAYYDFASVRNNRTIRIFDRDSNAQRCRAFGTPAFGIPASRFIRVILSIDDAEYTGSPADQSVEYMIPRNRVCNTGSATNMRNDPDNSNNGFFGTYQVPSGFTQANVREDESGSHLYKLRIRIQYARNPAGTAVAVPLGSNSNKQQVTFRVRLDRWDDPPCRPGTAASSICTRYIGALPLTTLDGTRQNYSTLGPYENLSGDVTPQRYYTRQLFKFGLPCTQTTPSSPLDIYVYDVDNQNTWRDVNISVQSSTDGWATSVNTLVEGTDYTANSAAPLTFTDGRRTITPGGADKSSVRIQLVLQPSVNYRIVVRNVHFRNLIGVGLPGPTIFGDLSCAYSLTPTVDIGSSTLSPGQPVTGVRGDVSNTSIGVTSGVTRSAVVRYVIPSAVGGGSPGGGTTSTPDSSGFGCRIVDVAAPVNLYCSQIGTPRTGTFPPGGPTPVLSPTNDALTGVNIQPGDRVCYMTVVNNYSQASTVTDWHYSASGCVLVAKLPFVQVWGNDLRVGGRYASDGTIDTDKAAIRASLMRFDGRYYGSWTEYGVLAPGQVTGMASGYGLAEGQTSNNQADWSGLTFARTTAPDPDCPTGFGCFTTGDGMGTLPDVSTGNSALDVIIKTPRTTIGADTNYTGSEIWHNTGNITITGDITAASGPYSSEGNIPQRIIIAQNINIDPNVKRIDAWLIATDTINTCTGSGPLTATTCNEPLVINGPTIAKTLVMRRTAGADSLATATDPAEQFNLRGDTYIWAYNQAQRTGTIRTSYVRELAPRY